MLNTVILMGRLTADPELRTTTTGTEVASFTIAVDPPYTKDKKADFIRCVAWKEKATFLGKYFTKGQMIAVQGSLQGREYTDVRQNKKTVFEVVVDHISFCGGKDTEQKPDTAPAIDVIDDDDLPWN